MKISNNIKKIFKLFQQFNKQIYLVGGCVRDIIMGNTPHDFDFTTDATPDEMKEIAKSANIEVIPTGEKYGTLTFHINNEFYEITTFRTDGNYSDGRRPDKVVFSKELKDDLCRRDFTFNSMCFSFNEKNNGVKLIDIYNGKKDLENGIINTIDKAEDRFNEDALRILRAIRFAYKFGFNLSLDIRKAIVKQVNLLDNISMERIREEIFKILSCYKPSEINDRSLHIVLNKVLGSSNVDLIDEFGENIFIETRLLYILSSNLDREKINDKLVELKCSNKFIKDSLIIYDCFKYMEKYKEQEDLSFVFKKCLNRCNKDFSLFTQSLILFSNNNIEFLFDYEDLIRLSQIILKNNEPITLADLAVNGDDLINWGIKGKKCGELLQIIQEKVWLDPVFNNKELIKEFVKVKTIY